MQIPVEQLINVCRREIKSKIGILSIAFIFLSIAVIIIGSFWPQMYESSTTILADQGVLTDKTLGENVGNASSMITSREATELMFSRQVLDRILEVGGWLEEDLSDQEQESLKEEIRARSKVDITGNLLKISYRDRDTRRAFLVASEFAEQFIRQSAAASRRESEDVYDFVDIQVKEYHKKLQESEKKLKEFRNSVVDASPERKLQVFQIIETLESNVRRTRIELKEAKIRKESLEQQLKEEGGKSSSSSTAELYRKRLQEMKDDLDILRLSYHDTYPDIVRLKQQIEEMKQSIQTEERNHRERQAQGLLNEDNTGSFSTLHDTLRKQLASVKTEIFTHQTRMAEYEDQLKQEKERAKKMGDGQAQESELVRDYTVNQDFYQELLRKRENARVSMNLALQDSGLSYKIQEKANLPLIPIGLRFLHFVIAGPIVALMIPIGLLVIFIQLDPRIRARSSLEDSLGLPFLMNVPPMHNALAITKTNIFTIIMAVVAVVVFYVFVIGVRLAQSNITPVIGGA